MTEPDFDFVVLGGGSAGYAGAATAARLGLKTAVIEGGEEVGGLCILRGCMPSKALLESAHRAEAIRHAADFGLRAEYHGADGAALRARKRRLIGEFAEYRRQQLAGGNFTFLRGEASFVDPHTVAVRRRDGTGTDTIRSRAFLIATGSRIQFHDVPGLKETGFWTSDEVLDNDRLPESVTVVGGGSIALELASFYAGIGARVTVIQRSEHVLREMDEDLTDELVRALEARGIAIFRETKLLRVERMAGLKRVHFAHAGGVRFVDSEELVYALGREPATEGLELAKAGVATERRRVSADVHQRCGPPHIFAAGDVCGPYEVVHIAIYQAELAARNAARALGRLPGPMEETDYRLVVFGVFTDPQIAMVGMTERDARAEGEMLVARYSFADHGKSIIHGANHGFVKLIVEKDSRRIRGAACVGPEAVELIHEIVVAMHFRATADDLARIPHYHPTLSEIWTYPAEALSGMSNLMPP